MKFETRTAISDADQINVYGYDLTKELVGHINLADMIFLGVKNRKPTDEESKMLNAVMVSVAEHGFTPSSIAARLTYLGAPEASQAAIASGLLGAGTVYLGAMEATAELLQLSLAESGEMSIEQTAQRLIADYSARNRHLPGFGHPIHKPVDPRTVRLFELAEECGFKGKHVQLMNAIHQFMKKEKNKDITLNAAGAIGAVLSDMDIHYKIVKPIMVAARAVGLVGHIAEEIEAGRKQSTGQKVFDYFNENTEYKY